MTIRFERKRSRSGAITKNLAWKLLSESGTFMGEIKWNERKRTFLFWSSGGWRYSEEELDQILDFMTGERMARGG